MLTILNNIASETETATVTPIASAVKDSDNLAELIKDVLESNILTVLADELENYEINEESVTKLIADVKAMIEKGICKDKGLLGTFKRRTGTNVAISYINALASSQGRQVNIPPVIRLINIVEKSINAKPANRFAGLGLAPQIQKLLTIGTAILNGETIEEDKKEVKEKSTIDRLEEISLQQSTDISLLIKAISERESNSVTQEGIDALNVALNGKQQ